MHYNWLHLFNNFLSFPSILSLPISSKRTFPGLYNPRILQLQLAIIVKFRFQLLTKKIRDITNPYLSDSLCMYIAETEIYV